MPKPRFQALVSKGCRARLCRGLCLARTPTKTAFTLGLMVGLPPIPDIELISSNRSANDPKRSSVQHAIESESASRQVGQDVLVNSERVAIITGSSRGIGAATAKLLARDGHRICVNYRSDETAANAVVNELASGGTMAIAVQADVGKEDDVVRLFEIVDQELGPVSALVNNAGIVLPQMRVEDMDASRINQIFTTNVTGAFLCCREAVKRMSTRHGGQGGSIVNVSSAASRIGSAGEYVDYAASKGAIDTLTRGLSLEVAAEGIRVNCVRPGFIYTEMHAAGGEPNRVDRLADSIPMKRGGTPEEVAHSILWLLSDDASYITGTFIEAAGGR